MKNSKIYTVRGLQMFSGLASVIVVFIIGITSFLGWGGMKVMHVVSDSMVPTFRTGDVLIVSTQDKNNIHEGDMVAYEAEWLDNKTVTHRVKSVNDDKVITRGDNNDMADPEFTKDKLIGKISAIVPGLGGIFSPAGILGLSLGSIGLLVAAESLEKLWFRNSEKFSETTGESFANVGQQNFGKVVTKKSSVAQKEKPSQAKPTQTKPAKPVGQKVPVVASPAARPRHASTD